VIRLFVCERPSEYWEAFFFNSSASVALILTLGTCSPRSGIAAPNIPRRDQQPDHRLGVRSFSARGMKILHDARIKNSSYSFPPLPVPSIQETLFSPTSYPV